MTLEEMIREWDVTYQTTLGRMVGTAEPTEKQKQLAAIEADNHIAKLKEQGE